MEHFKEQFEAQKIPEWYNYYFDYDKILKCIKDIKNQENFESIDGDWDIKSQNLGQKYLVWQKREIVDQQEFYYDNAEEFDNFETHSTKEQNVPNKIDLSQSLLVKKSSTQRAVINFQVDDVSSYKSDSPQNCQEFLDRQNPVESFIGRLSATSNHLQLQQFVDAYYEEVKRTDQQYQSLYEKLANDFGNLQNVVNQKLEMLQQEFARLDQTLYNDEYFRVRFQDHQKAYMQNKHSAKTQLELATNWGRAFNELYTSLKWLNSYASINRQAFQQIIHEMGKQLLQKKQTNLLQASLIMRTKQEIGKQIWYASNQISELQNEIIEFYSSMFTANDKQQARKIIEITGIGLMRRKDLILLSFFFGCNCIMLPVNAVILLNNVEIGKWTNIIQIYRAFLFMSLIIIGTASATKILEYKKINYIHIFEISFYQQLTPVQFLVMGLGMLSALNACLMAQMIQFQYLQSSNLKLPTLIFVAFIFVTVFSCVQYYHEFRWELCIVFKDIIISPFSPVNFKRFFIADILTSSKLVLTDVFSFYYFFSQGDYYSNQPNPIKLSNLLTCIVFTLPFWFRFFQCIKRFKQDPTNETQLRNAFKYLCGIISTITQFLASINVMLFALFLFCQTFSTIFSYGWDVYMDWGLFRNWDCPKRRQKQKHDILNPLVKKVEIKNNDLRYALRDKQKKIAFTCWFYYWAILSNFFLRLTWVIKVIANPVTYPWVNSLWFGTLLGLLELFRRWQWALIRIENEQVNNLEKYRVILEVPEVRPLQNQNEEEEIFMQLRQALKNQQ